MDILDGYYNGTWTITTPANPQGPIGNACAGSPIMPGVVYSIPFPAQYIGIDLGVAGIVCPQEKEEIIVGCACKKCKEYNEYASPNQDDKTFICYACRHNL